MKYEIKDTDEPWSAARELEWASDLHTASAVAGAWCERFRDELDDGDLIEFDLRCTYNSGKIKTFRVTAQACVRIYFDVFSVAPLCAADEVTQ